MVSSSWREGFEICQGNILPGIQGDCNREQEHMRNYHIGDLICCEPDLGPLPAGREDLESAGGIFCQVFSGTVIVNKNK